MYWTLLLVLILSWMLYHNRLTYNGLDKCPLCFGQEFCGEFTKLSMRYDTLRHLLYNTLSTKNVYFATNGRDNVVIKRIDVRGQLFHVCDASTIDLLMRKVEGTVESFRTKLQVNAESLVFEVFSKDKGFAVPKLYGCCGWDVVVEDCGVDLGSFEGYSWQTRAIIAVHIIKAVKFFTEGHEDFRLYLADISPDNIVVDVNTLQITFVDLEHVILQRKTMGPNVHYSEHEDTDYSFSTQNVCESDVSDHNVYAVCRLLLWQNSPWPMMNGGLLHSPPSTLDVSLLVDQIDQCVWSSTKQSRFDLINRIEQQLEHILEKPS